MRDQILVGFGATALLFIVALMCARMLDTEVEQSRGWYVIGSVMLAFTALAALAAARTLYLAFTFIL